MTRLLLGQSYFLRFDPKLWDAMQPYPPLGTLYAAAVLREEGHEVHLFDAMLAESEADWDAALAQHQPDIAVIYEDNFNYLSKMCLLRMRQAAFTMAQMARDRNIPVILAGSDASDHPEAYLSNGADYVILGEGEETLRELVQYMMAEATGEPSGILGLAWQAAGPDGAPALHRTTRRPDIRDLDALPMPAWDLVDVDRYRRIWTKRHGYFSMNMVTTRGCPYHCNWCAKPIWGQRYNSRSPENVAAEMAELKARYRPDHIWFVDDIMGLKPGWLPRFADAVEARGARIPFKCLSRVDLLLRDEDARSLARAGADIVWVGAESGSQNILTAMEKGTRVEQIYQAAARLREYGVKVAFFLQFGYPGETRGDIENTLQMVREIMPDDIGMSVSYPLPGTRFHEQVRDQLGRRQNWQDSSDLAMLYEGPFTTDFYRQLHVVLHKEYRARKTWRELRQRRSGLRRAATMVYHWLTLPFERRNLARLARQPTNAVDLDLESMPLEDSATPTPQLPD